ncbi:hypothetical protein GGD56_003172 [Rhizobium mongolense]|uniref:Uncharacterized protein n=2 Tax=Rhizobium mongolense TaxID=57676 RepID=A0ABR6INF0_9HYPH|nr:hypothetical protein [Rhizobium mongolense]TVZ63124.1 hypothetical protein BCL32_3245 [Rhizobium mongolense USDA 1844]
MRAEAEGRTAKDHCIHPPDCQKYRQTKGSRSCHVAGRGSNPRMAGQLLKTGKGLGEIDRSAEAWINIAHIRILTSRLARYYSY